MSQEHTTSKLMMMQLGGGFNCFLKVIPFDVHTFQMGWFNHQLGKLKMLEQELPSWSMFFLGKIHIICIYIYMISFLMFFLKLDPRNPSQVVEISTVYSIT